MKHLLVFALGAMPFFVFCQGVDTVAVVRQVDSLIQVCRTLTGQAKYDNALQVIETAKKKAAAVFGIASAGYANCVFNQGRVFRFWGKFDQAELLYLEAKAIREKVLGKEHRDYANSLNNLATLYREKGEYDKAVRLNLEAKAIREKVLGKENRDYAASLNNLALVYNDKGEYDKAESLHLEAKTIREKVLGKEHVEYVTSLNNLAIVYRVKGEYDKALPLCLEAKTIWEKISGKEDPDYAMSLNNLAIVYSAKGEYDKAVPLCLEAKTIWKKMLGEEHPDYAMSLHNLAIVYQHKGDYDKALPLYLEAKTILGKALGKEHPLYATSLHNLAGVYWYKGDNIRAASYFLSSNRATQSLLQKSAAYSSEKEMLQYQALFEEEFGALLHFTQTQPTDSLIFAAYDNALFLHNALLFNAAAREKGITQADSSTRALHAEWKVCHFQLSKQYAQPIAERDSAHVARLEERANEHEKELVRRSPAFVASQRMVHWQEVRDRLHLGEAAIEFVHYRYHNDKKKVDSDKSEYAALVLRPGDESPHWVTLFEERQLAALLGHSQAGKGDPINQLYGSPLLLYDLVWKPLEKWLGGVQRIYYAPSGLLHRLSLEGVRCAENQILAEKYDLHRLGSTRQLVVESPTPTFPAEDAVVYGGVRYDMDSSAMATANRAWVFEQNTEPDGCEKIRGDGDGPWGDLKWTEIEAKSVAALLKAAGARVDIRQGHAATEESFAFLGKKSAAPKVLHLATHAFFFPDPKDNPKSAARHPQSGEPVFKISEHPMMRSGLVLAGANRVWTGGKAPMGLEDGILTAYEISQMNLSGTELVVLSACETGLGDIQGNEGVYGLQRAFKIAGAKHLVMSLWQVSDYQTEELMTAFYREWLEGKKSIPEAFRSARVRVKTDHPEPFNWAGFVLVE